MPKETSASVDPSAYRIQRRFSPNILVIGETGVGKSSIINLIAGEELAGVSSGISGCMMEATSYDIILTDSQGLGHHIRLFDTVGLTEPSLNKKDYLMAIEKANSLIVQLQRTGGICLLIFCIRGGRITAVTQNNYRLFCDILCQGQVPVAFVITGMENEGSMEGWWDRNATLFKRSGLLCTSHVCVTATRGLNNVYARQYQESQAAIRDMLLGHLSTMTLFKSERGASGWFTLASKPLINDHVYKRHLIGQPGPMTVEELTRDIQDKCKFSWSEAVSLAEEILAKRSENTKPVPAIMSKGADMNDEF